MVVLRMGVAVGGSGYGTFDCRMLIFSAHRVVYVVHVRHTQYILYDALPLVAHHLPYLFRVSLYLSMRSDLTSPATALYVRRSRAIKLICQSKTS